MKDLTRVAAIQMVSTPDVDANLDCARRLLRQAAAEEAKLAVLPEYFPIIGDDEQLKLQYQEPFGDGPLQDFLAQAAKEHGFWLMGGTIPLQASNSEHVFNSCLLFNPDGECVNRYDKIHLFDVCVDQKRDESYNESNTIEAGNQVVVAETPFAKIGMSICYDLRFPELYRKMVDSGVDIITVPSAFTETTGSRHWQMLLRARAVENLSFIIAPNQGGQNTERRKTWGHSMIIDPWGEILVSMEKGPGVICADLDFAHMRELRNAFPALQHRKPLTDV